MKALPCRRSGVVPPRLGGGGGRTGGRREGVGAKRLPPHDCPHGQHDSRQEDPTDGRAAKLVRYYLTVLQSQRVASRKAGGVEVLEH